jgi:hypothetical protein
MSKLAIFIGLSKNGSKLAQVSGRSQEAVSIPDADRAGE